MYLWLICYVTSSAPLLFFLIYYLINVEIHFLHAFVLFCYCFDAIESLDPLFRILLDPPLADGCFEHVAGIFSHQLYNLGIHPRT